MNCIPFGKSTRRYVKQGVVTYLLLQSMYFGGYDRLTNALSRKGEFGDPELEHLMNWIKLNTKPGKQFLLIAIKTGQNDLVMPLWKNKFSVDFVQLNAGVLFFQFVIKI